MMLSTLSSVNSNTYKLCFWIMSYLLRDSNLLLSIRKETEPAFSEAKADMSHLLNSCPRLNALFDEVLRMTNSSSSMRNVTSETTVGGYKIRAGTKIIMPSRQLHFNEAVFGPNAHVLDVDRFLRQKSLNRDPSYRPFGGGSTYCPGRFIARQEVLAFVAIVLERFEIRLARTENSIVEQSMPLMEEKKPCLGVKGPVKNADQIVEISQRNVLKK